MQMDLVLSLDDAAGAAGAAPVTLGTLTLSGSLKVGDAASGTIIGATGGSTIAGNIPGITVNSGARTYSGTPTGSAATISNGLVETLAGASNTPNSSPITVTATAIPALANLIADWNADALAVVADGTSVPSWTDSIGGFTLSQGTAAPTYKNNGIGTRAGLDYNGTNQWLTGAAAAIMTAQAAKNITVMIVMTNTQATTFGFAFNLTSSTGVNWRHNLTDAGLPSGSEVIPYTSAGFTVGGYMYTSAYFSGHTTQHQIMLNGSLISQANTAMSTTGVTQPSIGASSTGTGPYKGRIARILVWNRKLTLKEWLQAERAVRDYYGQAYPWTAPGYYSVMAGDSIDFGYGMTARSKAWPYIMATSLSLPMGSWSNIGFIGANATDCANIATAEDLANIASVVGVPVKITYGEFYNQRSGATAPIASSASVIATQATLTALKACGKVLFWDTTDYANRGAEKARWTGYWATPANQTGYMDAFVALSGDANLGVDGACPNSPPYGAYFSNALANFTCNATTNSTTAVTVNSVSSGAANMVAGASFTGAGIQAGTTIVSGPGGGGPGAYVLSLPATSGTTGSFTGGSGDGVHPGDGAGAAFAAAIQTAFAGM